MLLDNGIFTFVGRKNEINQLLAAISQRRHVVISGNPGIGKSALLEQVGKRVPLLIRNSSQKIRHITANLGETFCAPSTASFQGFNALVSRIRTNDQPIAFDNLEELPTEIIALIPELVESVPIWIVVRSEPSQGLGRIGDLLGEFAHLKMPPLRNRDLRVFLARATVKGILPRAAVNHVGSFIAFATGIPPSRRNCYGWRPLKSLTLMIPSFAGSLRLSWSLWRNDCS
jgi:hypothetical protein